MQSERTLAAGAYPQAIGDANITLRFQPSSFRPASVAKYGSATPPLIISKARRVASLAGASDIFASSAVASAAASDFHRLPVRFARLALKRADRPGRNASACRSTRPRAVDRGTRAPWPRASRGRSACEVRERVEGVLVEEDERGRRGTARAAGFHGGRGCLMHMRGGRRRQHRGADAGRERLQRRRVDRTRTKRSGPSTADGEVSRIRRHGQGFVAHVVAHHDLLRSRLSRQYSARQSNNLFVLVRARRREGAQRVEIQAQPQEYDAIVVGTGASGGWAAKRISEAGLRVALVCAGRPLRTATAASTSNRTS